MSDDGDSSSTRAEEPQTPPPFQPRPIGDHPVSDVDPPTTSTVPAASAPAPTTEPFDAKKLDKKQSFIRHTPSAYNTFAYQPSVGKDLATLLVDESGMAPRFHLISAELFLASIEIDGPTEEDYKKFKKPDLAGKKKEHELYSELAAVVESVLEAAECDVLRFLDTANHKAKDGNSGKKETFNDGGIYKNSPLAREATEFTAEHRERSKMSSDDLARRLLGLRSWNWIDILFELKISEDLAAFYFKTQPRLRKKELEALAAQSAKGKATDFSSEGEKESEGDVTRVGDDGDGGDVGRQEDDGEAVEGQDEDDGPPEQDDIATSSKGKSVAHDDPSASDAAASDRVPASDNGVEETEATPGPITLKVPPFIKQSGKGKIALGQFVEYMLNVQKNQHRVFSYSVYICSDMARLLYFDRSGAFVSKPFSWDDPKSLLHQFVWKIAKLANAGRFAELGHDETASLASDEEKEKFLTLKDDTSLPQHVRDGFKKATADKWPIYKLEVAPGEPSEDEWFSDIHFPPPKEFTSSSTSQPQPSPSRSTPPSKPSSEPPATASDNPLKLGSRYFLVGRPHFAADGLVGRCTRGYLAYDITDADEKNWRTCFLKDSWRPVVPGRTRPEHLVYQRLRFCGVDRGIATLICGGDVGGHWAQRTKVQDFLPEENRPVLRVHYRLVIEEIGIRLEDFTSFPELSAIFVDVIIAHHDAWTLANVLHRDISVGNIMILPATAHSPRRMGFLIDWDLSRLESELGIGPVEPDRTGTWQFRSALSLAMPWKPYRRTDDVESFIHVYLYLVLRYHVTSVLSLQELVKTYFEGVSLIHGIKVGGDRKLALLTSAKLSFRVYSNPKLQHLLETIFLQCSQSYNMLDLTEMHLRYGFPQPSPQPISATPDPTETVTVPIFVRRNNLPRSKKPVSPSTGEPSPQPTPRADPDEDLSVVGGILADIGDLVDLFEAHAMHPRLDKACDQFPARQHQDVYQAPIAAGTRSIGSMSTSGTILSQKVSSNASSSFSLNFGRPGSNPGPSMPGTSFDSKKRARIVSGAPVQGAIASNEQGPSNSAVHRNKRAK
ncbi:hypothetical protein V8D89_005003 [Ganoderma adspersum]